MFKKVYTDVSGLNDIKEKIKSQISLLIAGKFQNNSLFNQLSKIAFDIDNGLNLETFADLKSNGEKIKNDYFQIFESLFKNNKENIVNVTYELNNQNYSFIALKINNKILNILNINLDSYNPITKTLTINLINKEIVVTNLEPLLKINLKDLSNFETSNFIKKYTGLANKNEIFDDQIVSEIYPNIKIYNTNQKISYDDADINLSENQILLSEIFKHINFSDDSVINLKQKYLAADFVNKK
ncbi:UNVERIFIED_CONTAM: hypothetical protein O8I53_05875 [Campylobacter lari]